MGLRKVLAPSVIAPRRRLWGSCRGMALILGFGLNLLLAPLPAWADDDLQAARKAVRMRQFDKAFELYEVAAQNGDPEAQYQLAMLYSRGQGAPKNDNRARLWLERAANQKHAGASYLLSQKLREVDPARAEELLHSAASKGYSTAERHLQRDAEALARPADPSALTDQWFGAARSQDHYRLQQLLDKGVAPDIKNKAGRTALFTAAAAGKDKSVRWLLQQGLDVNHRDRFGLTALQTALENGHLGVLKILLEAGAQPGQVLANGDSLLHFALRLDRVDSARLLIKHGAPINLRNKEGWTPLDVAEAKGLPGAIQHLQQVGAENGLGWQHKPVKRNVAALAKQVRASSDLSPLASAVVNSNVELLKTLLKSNPQGVRQPLPDGSSLLGLAVRHNSPDMVQVLLDHGVDANAGAYNGMTALHIATRLEREEIVEILLDEGASPLVKDDAGKDAVHAAIEEGHNAVAEILLDYLLEHGLTKQSAQMDKVPVDYYLLAATEHRTAAIIDRLMSLAGATQVADSAGRNALWFAARDQNAELVTRLLEAGVAPSHADQLGRTPFLVAVESACFECARTLLPVDKIDRQTLSGNTALMIAAQNGDLKMARWLLSQKADVELRNQRGNTAVMEAVNSKSAAIVKDLLAANANVSRKNKLGFSAIDLAAQVSPEMLDLVKSKAVLGIF